MSKYFVRYQGNDGEIKEEIIVANHSHTVLRRLKQRKANKESFKLIEIRGAA